ncbi:hypothetical protein [Streptomyces sp. PAM3C]|uniref:hypothetical protein n=1 Tax=Streptomyces sp. PAM3C TaxID=2847300 RepID=UPI001C1E0CD2|nr:hypothetical protein [Streptomyces sp. PAM3C]MBU5944907.1 hypothetical protein [Streptomyces sp. PAM3C]
MAEGTETAAAGTGSYQDGPAGLAYRALLEHTRECGQCVENVSGCGTGRALVRTLRDAVRTR